MRLIDPSHMVEHGTIAYRELPAPAICDFLSREGSRAIYAPGTEFQIRRIDLDAVEATASGGRAIAREAEIPISEHIRNLGNLPGSGFRFSAVPVKVSGSDTFPVRAYAMVEDGCSGG